MLDSLLPFLRELLADSRRVGLSFCEAWPEDCHFAVRELGPGSKASWLEVFVSTKVAWRSAYERSRAGAVEQFGVGLVDDGPAELAGRLLEPEP
jgi:hypothetical protein